MLCEAVKMVPAKDAVVWAPRAAETEEVCFKVLRRSGEGATRRPAAGPVVPKAEKTSSASILVRRSGEGDGQHGWGVRDAGIRARGGAAKRGGRGRVPWEGDLTGGAYSGCLGGRPWVLEARIATRHLGTYRSRRIM